MTELHRTQIAVKKMVDRGEISKAQGICIILQKAMDLLEDLKMPENQDWEKYEYPEMFSNSN